eukprot:TRINITY_DN3438_c1_g1_i13.p3 TRINITY_DN3438_c1_g1~~TRINITY_DN3438_c1_g1_i13.p3  ORF type:complete len:113 (+),score=1.37 TRINITY_DN3438_c1_g1_i13:414-752(+)
MLRDKASKYWCSKFMLCDNATASPRCTFFFAVCLHANVQIMMCVCVCVVSFQLDYNSNLITMRKCKVIIDGESIGCFIFGRMQVQCNFNLINYLQILVSSPCVSQQVSLVLL